MTVDSQQTMDRLQQAFREWVRKGMPDPAPSFEGLIGSSMYLPADVINILATERGLISFWTYGQAVRQLMGSSSEEGA